MLVSRQKHLDVLMREPDESFADYCKAVKYYQRSVDITLGEFLAQVGAGGLSLKETGILCRSLREECPDRVLRYPVKPPQGGGIVERRCVK